MRYDGYMATSFTNLINRRLKPSQKVQHSLPGWNTNNKVRQRGAVRMETYANCGVEIDAGGYWEGVMLDLSDTGARVRFNFRGSIISDVFITCPRHRLKRRARVVWARDSEFGFQFI